MKQKDILIILILLFVFVVAWIGSSIYHAIVSSTISETTNQDIAPIGATFDTKTITDLKKRQEIIPSFELESMEAQVASPSPTILPEPTITQEVASQSGKSTL